MTPEQALQKYFGLSEFRHSQGEVISTILEGKDALVIMPTGGGKSLCYQLPSLIMDGVTVVVSPLISLMQDQVDSLVKLEIPATLINSTLSPQEVDQRFNDILAGKYKLVYIAPERFRSPRFTSAMQRLKINFFAIDEAHCISQWGHDFRPDYLRVGEALKGLGSPPVAAFTATATPTVKADIIKNLGIADAREFITGFSRPNLELKILPVEKNTQRYAHLGKLIDEQKTGIIYCATRKRVEKVALTLQGWDCSIVSYHGGMSDDERKDAQDQFMQKKVDIAVATNAFGMGIDRSDIRFVAHFEMPGSVEAYYQEVGRAGRDGGKSVCELYYNYADRRIHEFFIEGSNPGKQMIASVYQRLQLESDSEHMVSLSIEDLAERIGKGVNSMAVGTSLSILARANCIERLAIPGQRAKGTRLLQPNLAAMDLPIDFDTLRKKEERDFEKLEELTRFVDAYECRQQWILNYFGEGASEACGLCDRCRADNAETTREPTTREGLIVQKALSGVARMSFRSSEGEWIPRFGRNKVIQMLLGSKDQGLKTSGLDQLSTYGILEDEKKSYLNALFKELERIRAIKTVIPENYPLITLTAHGEKVMRAQVDYRLVWPEDYDGQALLKKKAAAKLSGDSEDDGLAVDAELYELLRKKRITVAKNMRNARLFMVLPNKTLRHLAAAKPRSIDEAREIPGIGPAKMNTVLPQFLEVIENYVRQERAAVEA